MPVYWIGQDGNVWFKGESGTRNAGKLITDYGNGFNAADISAQGERIDDPLAPQNRETAGGSTAAADQASALSQIDDQIGSVNQGLGRIGNQRNIGRENIGNSYNSSLNKLFGDKATAQRDYETNKTDTTQGFLGSRAGLREGARNQLNNVKRLLGQAGAGSSSAYNEAAPLAIGKESNNRFEGVKSQFLGNVGKLETQWGDTERNFGEYEKELAADKANKERELEAGLAQTELGFQDKLQQLATQRAQAQGQGYAQARQASEGYRNRINEMFTNIDNLGRQYQSPVLVNRDIKFTRPDLAQYNYDRFGAPSQRTGQTDATGSFYQLLGNQDERKRQV